MQIKAVIFDLDNTLVDFMKMKREAVAGAARAMVDHGLPMKESEAYDRLFEIYEREGIENQEVLDHFLTEELGRLDHRLLAAGVVAYRRAREELIRRGYKLGVLSDAPSRQAWLRLANLGLLHYFQHVITHDDTGKWKPDPAPFRKMLEVLALGHDEVLMVGDWPDRDIQGARNLHIRTALALYGSDFDTENCGADFLLHSVDELLPILDTINGGRHPGWAG